MFGPTEDEREEQREALKTLGFGGPRLIGGDVFLSTYVAICLTCGAMILLGDQMEAPHNPGAYIERGIFLHYGHHHPDDVLFTPTSSDQEQRP